MVCPTCDHTLQSLGHGLFHCPRCGTLVGSQADGSADVPALVKRCRGFQREFRGSVEYHTTLWIRLGIHECIDTPAERDRARQGY
jgi:hypothetical protein